MTVPNSASPRPGVLMLGTVHHAKPELEKLSEVASIEQVTSGTRQGFIRECDAGTYSHVVAISRTYDSVAITGRFDAELISHLPASVKFLSHNGAGYDQIDVNACTERGISVSNTPGAVDAATANTAIFLMLGALRRAWVPQLAVREGKWRGDSALGRDPDGLTLGILGMGGIGTATAKRAAAFGFRLQYHNRSRVAGLDELFAEQGAPRYVSFEELLRTSHVISVHLPLGPATRGLIGAKELDAMKDGVVIVNTARGPIIDEAALVSALESGKVRSVGLDVYEKEPEIHPGLLKHPGTMLLPHIGTATVDTQRRMEVLVIDNVKSAVTRGKLLTQVPEQRPPVAKV
ncbi:d-isomer specific 2-hydroxyacid dehydrogenase, NAD binding domain-containing protein [Hirsutella rhossiliensis]|uniref:D-isomer specific 2-hydroxyacid dehydrogenase, NAD binding domain-containing protein n=1 Tax=Hirsutella rhossiliensis TaxID=111463 RepID=A0A9P8SJ03_9HYPO|nr:d-isomer specific 2-hydroxyacid dehydrogenase, NAD binding domain-containing protein [Hirsutella rhossiliensis]KAH0963724.1 d-isomer specific 2-hydroxyacid dehydrogenase, NAD binding domain-containing protein [Hirsutella rhossiliensis]